MPETRSRPAVTSASPADVVLRRLGALAPLSDREAALVLGLASQRQTHAPGSELYGEGHILGRPKVILSGWACRARVLSDGRRQIFTFLTPGDAIGLCAQPEARALSTTLALTRVTTADATVLADAIAQGAPRYGGLAAAAAAAGKLEEARLLDHLVRLGRQTAYERLAHLFLELRWRLAVVGLGSESRFPLPLTQEVLADALGLSIVHVNRTLQQLRREKLLEVRNGFVELLQPEVLIATADFCPPLPLDLSGRGL